ncbi:MAG: hypothetical protein F6K62_11030 [Sphaerospermopsis sp. SIO1G2]|nr:hypothetical protein [Sphaerospermopsis sp. SIO1G2]
MSTDISALETHYHQITELYDLADELVATVEDPRTRHPQQQLTLIEPLVEQIGESTDILCEEFILVAGKQEGGGRSSTSSIEAAFRKIYVAIDNYKRALRRHAHQSVTGIKNIADAVVDRITRHVERVIAMMVAFVDLSLERIMQRQHLEDIRRRQETIDQIMIAAEKHRGFEMRA